MSTIPHISNGRRPSLNEQINRLDKILDGLSEGLNGAIVDAVKNTVGAVVKEAVQAVLLELLANPEMLTRLQPAHATEAPTPAECAVPAPAATGLAPRGCFQRVGSFLSDLHQECDRGARTAGSMVSHFWQAVLRPFRSAFAWCRRVVNTNGRTILLATASLLLALTVWQMAPWLRFNAQILVHNAASAFANLWSDNRPVRRHRAC
jgi:hypothetical protein